MVATWETTALIEQDIAHMLHPVTNLHRHAQDGPLIFTHGKGSLLWDSDGKEYIDGFAGLWNVNVGHGREPNWPRRPGSRWSASPSSRPSSAWRRRR